MSFFVFFMVLQGSNKCLFCCMVSIWFKKLFLNWVLVVFYKVRTSLKSSSIGFYCVLNRVLTSFPYGVNSISGSR